MGIRRFVLAAIGILLLSLGVATAQGVCEGVDLNVAMLQWPPTDATQAITPEFEELTGADVSFDVMPWEQAHEKILLELGTQSSTYDVVTIDGQWTGELIAGGHLLPLPYEEWQADPAFDYDGIVSSYLEAYGAPMGEPGELYVFPFATDTPLFFYRTDLFDDPQHQAEFEARYGRPLAPPVTWEEYRDIAEYFTQDRNGDGTIDLYGTTMQAAQGDPIANDFRIFLYGFGGSILNEDLEVVVDSPEAANALSFYQSLYEDGFVAEGSLAYGYDEVLAALQLDRAATSILWATFWPGLQDPEQSEVVGKIGASVLPRASYMEEPAINLGGWGIAVPRYGENIDCAVEYVKWFLSPDVQTQYALQGGTSPRPAVLTDPDVISDQNTHFPAFAESLEYGVPILDPVLPEFTQIDRTNALWASRVLTGEVTVEQALASLQQQLEEVLAAAGR